MDQERRYYSERQGRGPKGQPLPFDTLRKLIVSVFDHFEVRGYFQEAFGYECVDAGKVPGTLGAYPDAFFLREVGREGVFPWGEQVAVDAGPMGDYYYEPLWAGWDADTTFDMVEVLHDLVSKPTNGRYHDYAGCGWHYSEFDKAGGQAEYRSEMNKVLRLADPPYELTGDGHVLEAAPDEFRPLLAADVPAGTDHDLITSRLHAALERFRARGATPDDRRHAVRDLADVLEALRGDVKDNMLSADENALFQLANGFAIRHNNRKQRGDYDRVIWLRWAFYVYLATIHAVLRVRDAQDDADR